MRSPCCCLSLQYVYLRWNCRSDSSLKRYKFKIWQGGSRGRQGKRVRGGVYVCLSSTSQLVATVQFGDTSQGNNPEWKSHCFQHRVMDDAKKKLNGTRLIGTGSGRTRRRDPWIYLSEGRRCAEDAAVGRAASCFAGLVLQRQDPWNQVFIFAQKSSAQQDTPNLVKS